MCICVRDSLLGDAYLAENTCEVLILQNNNAYVTVVTLHKLRARGRIFISTVLGLHSHSFTCAFSSTFDLEHCGD